jgi:ribonucleoside-triphosphate reductase
LPVGFTSDIFEALDIQDRLQTLYTSGTVFHAFLGEKLPDWQSTAMLVKKIAENYSLPYYTISPTYSVCEEHGYINGEHYTCPECGKTTEVYSRITGYYRPVQNWNDGKVQEFRDRKCYDVQNAVSLKKKEENVASEQQKYLLFTTKTCPNCRVAKMILDKAGINRKEIDAQENLELAKRYGVMQAPTLVEVSNDGFILYESVPAIKAFTERVSGELCMM